MPANAPDIEPVDEALHSAIYDALRGALDASGDADVPVYDRLPDAGKDPADPPTAMPYVVISELIDSDTLTSSTRGQSIDASLVIYSDSSSRTEIYRLKRIVAQALDGERFSLDGHDVSRALFQSGPVRNEPDPAQGRSLYRADLTIAYRTQQLP